MQEMRVRSLGQGDPLAEETATHGSILAWGIPRTEEPGLLYSSGVRKSWARLSDSAHTQTPRVGRTCPKSPLTYRESRTRMRWPFREHRHSQIS